MPKAQHVMTVACNVRKPVVKEPISYSGSIYCAPLTAEEMREIRETSAAAEHKISLENIAYGSSMKIFNLESLSEQRFAWEQQLLFSMVLKRQLPQFQSNKEVVDLLRRRPEYYDIAEIEELSNVQNPAKEDLTRLGYEFKFW
jgi:hypothetical protein